MLPAEDCNRDFPRGVPSTRPPEAELRRAQMELDQEGIRAAAQRLFDTFATVAWRLRVTHVPVGAAELMAVGARQPSFGG
jgi:hypothetical protein